MRERDGIGIKHVKDVDGRLERDDARCGHDLPLLRLILLIAAVATYNLLLKRGK
jgi:hypothetical protein